MAHGGRSPTRDVKWMAPYEDRREALKAQMQDFYDLVILLLDTGAGGVLNFV